MIQTEAPLEHTTHANDMAHLNQPVIRKFMLNVAVNDATF